MSAFKWRLGVAMLVALFLASAAYPLIASLPLPACPLGADVEFPARTVCERTFGGLWSSLSIGLIAGGGATLLGLGVALLARWRGGITARIVPRAAALVFSIPDVLVLIAIAFAARVLEDTRGIELPPYWMTAGALIAVGWAGPAQMFLARLTSLERMEFVEAARALGATRRHVLARHVLPSIRDFALAVFLLKVPAAILAESTVSFLGFGLPPDQPSLGTYFGQNYEKLMFGDWRIIMPAWVLLVLTVLAFHWTGDSLRARQR